MVCSCETLLCFYSCLLASDQYLSTGLALPALSLFSESRIRGSQDPPYPVFFPQVRAAGSGLQKGGVPAAWREWIDYEIMPLLTFPDMTTFAIEDYFDEDSFESLLTDYETLGDTYKDLVGAREYNRVAGYWREERNDDAYVCYDFYKDGGVYYHYSHSWYDEETHEYHYNSVSKDGRYTYDEENETVTVHYTSCYDDTHDDWYTIDESHTYTVEFYRDKMILKEGTQTIVLE